jgi:hypothetical protein
MTLDNLKSTLPFTWSKLTTSLPDQYNSDNPALGQCAVTALVIQDYWGGKIVNTIVTYENGLTTSHYFNIIDGQAIDITRSQFPSNVKYSKPKQKLKNFSSTREYILSNHLTARRYRLLKSRVDKLLDEQISSSLNDAVL